MTSLVASMEYAAVSSRKSAYLEGSFTSFLLGSSRAQVARSCLLDNYSMRIRNKCRERVTGTSSRVPPSATLQSTLHHPLPVHMNGIYVFFVALRHFKVH